MPAASSLAALFLALRGFSVGLGALQGLRLPHLALLLVLFWSRLLAVCSLIRRWARAERSVNPRMGEILKISSPTVQFRSRFNLKQKHRRCCQVTFGTGARICAVAVAAFGRPLLLRSFALQPHPDRSSRQNLRLVCHRTALNFKLPHSPSSS